MRRAFLNELLTFLSLAHPTSPKRLKIENAFPIVRCVRGVLLVRAEKMKKTNPVKY